MIRRGDVGEETGRDRKQTARQLDCSARNPTSEKGALRATPRCIEIQHSLMTAQVSSLDGNRWRVSDRGSTV